MRYWWVNHKQTFKSEFFGGYIWSPSRNKNGSFNQTYLNLTLVSVGDIVFSYADTRIQAIGVATTAYKPANVPSEFGAIGEQWDKDGYLVSIEWTKLTTPFKPKDHILWIKDLLPSKHSPIQHNGNGNQGVYLAEIGGELAEKLIELVNVDNKYIRPIVDEIGETLDEDKEQEKIEKANIPETEKEQLIKARLGQGIFKRELATIEKGCRVTGVTNLSFLIASHIKPWCKSSNTEKLDGNNGLLLSPHVDRLFDRGFISFSDNGDILIKEDVKKVVETWGLSVKNVGAFNNKQKYYLADHRQRFNFQ